MSQNKFMYFTCWYCLITILVEPYIAYSSPTIFLSKCKWKKKPQNTKQNKQRNKNQLHHCSPKIIVIDFSFNLPILAILFANSSGKFGTFWKQRNPKITSSTSTILFKKQVHVVPMLSIIHCPLWVWKNKSHGVPAQFLLQDWYL